MTPKRKLKRWWWLSFAFETGPPSERFRGVVLVRARDAIEAIRISHALSINPGGQVIAFEMDADFKPPDRFRNRLLRRDDIEDLQGGEAKSLGELKAEFPERYRELFG